MTTWSAAGKVAATRDMLGRADRSPPNSCITVARLNRGAEPPLPLVCERGRIDRSEMHLPDISVAQIPIALKLKADNIVRRHYLLIGTAGSGLIAGLPLILNSTNTW